MKTRTEYWLAWCQFRYYRYRDCLTRKLRPYWQRICAVWCLWVDPPNTTRYIDCAIVNLRTYWLQQWALRIVTVLFITSMMTHIPAPRGANVHIGQGPEIAQYVDDLERQVAEAEARAEQARQRAAVAQSRAAKHRRATEALTAHTERLRASVKRLQRRALVRRIEAHNPDAPADQIAGAMLDASRTHGVPVDMLMAVAEIESDYRPQAVSDAGARGVMQIMPSVWRDKCPDLDTISGNAHCAARILKYECGRAAGLKDCLSRYNGSDSSVSANRYWRKYVAAATRSGGGGSP